ncbi:hypothetical protein KM043_010750 [Ampulex compressa]|nr:hypothetical protein KM043_010750 [Ampulex compressa]
MEFVNFDVPRERSSRIDKPINSKLDAPAAAKERIRSNVVTKAKNSESHLANTVEGFKWPAEPLGIDVPSKKARYTICDHFQGSIGRTTGKIKGEIVVVAKLGYFCECDTLVRRTVQKPGRLDTEPILDMYLDRRDILSANNTGGYALRNAV